ncbi:MAG: ribosome maturation factor RimM [Pseudomonadota bacterium]
MEQWIAIGRIGRAKGLRGEVRVEVYNPDSQLLENVRSIASGTDPSNLTTLVIQSLSQQPKSCVVHFDGVDTREAAEKLTGRELFAKRSDLPELPKGEYYHVDLIGCDVKTENGEWIGTLRSVMTTPSNDIYVVNGPRGESLFPAIPEVVVRVELEKRQIVIRPAEVVDAV